MDFSWLTFILIQIPFGGFTVAFWVLKKRIDKQALALQEEFKAWEFDIARQLQTRQENFMDITQLKDKLSEIKQMEYVVSQRKGNTGIGYTLETLLGLKENNLKTPDFDRTEIPEKGGSNRVTMFTFNRGVWKIKQKELIEKYGYVDTNGRPSLYCTAKLTKNSGIYALVVGKNWYECTHSEIQR